MRRPVLASLAAATMFAAASANAMPTLQLDILDGTYDTASETVFATGNSFALYAYLIPSSTAPLTDNYFLSMALVPSQSSSGNYGSFSFGATSMNVTGSMTYGSPPLEAILASAGYRDPGDLAPHGVFPTYFYEQQFNFSSGNQAARYDTIENPGQGPLPGTGMYFAQFDVDVSGLSAGYGIHFDLYNEKLITKCRQKTCTAGDIDVNQFAPFSHDAQGMVSAIPEPETYAMLLAGLGLLGLMRWRRAQNKPAIV